VFDSAGCGGIFIHSSNSPFSNLINSIIIGLTKQINKKLEKKCINFILENKDKTRVLRINFKIFNECKNVLQK